MLPVFWRVEKNFATNFEPFFWRPRKEGYERNTGVTDLTEIDLLQAAQCGDLEAFDDLQRRLEPPLERFVTRLVGSLMLAEDILQDVFLALYLNLKAINPPEKLRPYVFRMARNRCYDEFRRWERQPIMSIEDEPVEMWLSFTTYDEQTRPDELTHWMLLYLEVQGAMDQLPDLQRETLMLYSEENLSYAEISEVMNTSLGTVKSRLFHAKQGLRRLLHPDTVQAIEGDL